MAQAETFAGNASPGSGGDGGPARAAGLNQPSACNVDSFGNLFIADTLNHRIRKVAPAGIITTVVGTGDAGYSGDEGPAAAALTLYATGEGLTDGPNVSGRTAQSPYPRPQLPVSLKIANLAAEVVDAFSAPGVVGMLQVTARVPAGLPPGQAVMQLSVGSGVAPDLTIWVK